MKTTTLVLTASVTAAAMLSVAACTRQARVESGPGVAADTLEGTVRQVGNTPFVRTVVKGEDASATIVGEYESELANAAGARVRVWGTYRDGERPGREMEAAGYEILAVDGVEPTVGTLRHSSGRGYYVATAGGREVDLAGVPDRLGTRVGAKIWVVLGDGGGVQRYGVLREP